MPLILSDQDLVDLQTFAMRNFRGDEVVQLQNWLVSKKQAQRQADAAQRAHQAMVAPGNGATDAAHANGAMEEAECLTASKPA